MSAALSLMIATYILIRVRAHDRPPADRTRADFKIAIAADVICLVCWIVVAFQALRAALGLW